MSMADAAEQVERNREIVVARAAGETITSLATRFGISESRVKQVLRQGHSAQQTDTSPAIELAIERRAEYATVVRELRGVASRVPDAQPAAKVGA